MNWKDSTAKNMPKIAELKLSSFGLEVADFRKNCDCGIAEHHFFKSCGIAIAEVLPSSCGIAIADSKKSCACPPLVILQPSCSEGNVRKLFPFFRTVDRWIPFPKEMFHKLPLFSYCDSNSTIFFFRRNVSRISCSLTLLWQRSFLKKMRRDVFLLSNFDSYRFRKAM